MKGECRARVAAHLAAYRGLVKGSTASAAVRAKFETVYFSDQVLLLDAYFVHRTRALEGKDGNAMNEVRVLCTSMLTNSGRLLADKQIKLAPAKSVLGLKVGDEIALTEAGFVRLSSAYFEAIGRTFD